MKSYLEQAFGRGDVTSARMQAAIREWLNLYYGTQSPGEDAADRLAVLVVSKLCRTCLLYTSPSPRDYATSRMPSSA